MITLKNINFLGQYDYVSYPYKFLKIRYQNTTK